MKSLACLGDELVLSQCAVRIPGGFYLLIYWDLFGASPVAQLVKNLPANAGDVGLISGKIPWRRKWHPTPAYLPGKFHGQRSLVG